MITLPQHQSKRFHFRRLNVSIEVIRLSDRNTNVKIEMPSSLTGGGFKDSEWKETSDESLTREELSQRRHQICNQLQIAEMSLDILNQRVADGEQDLERILQMAIESLDELEHMAA